MLHCIKLNHFFLARFNQMFKPGTPPSATLPFPSMLYLVALVALGGLAFAGWLAAWVLAKDEGDEKMRHVPFGPNGSSSGGGKKQVLWVPWFHVGGKMLKSLGFSLGFPLWEGWKDEVGCHQRRSCGIFVHTASWLWIFPVVYSTASNLIDFKIFQLSFSHLTRYASIFKLAVAVLIGIFLMYVVREPPKNLPQVPSSRLAVCVAVSFATGSVLSGIAGYVGMPLGGWLWLTWFLGWKMMQDLPTQENGRPS